jgi:hypothetical protein
MTGTGTQADPFKPTTWEEFLSCTTSDGVYTELPEGGGTFDMNDYYPEGITEIIPLRGFINGNGWTIKNAYYRGSRYAFEMSTSDSYGKITELNFLNFRFEATGTGAALIGTSSGTYVGQAFTLCQFSGRIERVQGAYCAVTLGGYTSTHFRCSYNLEFSGQASVDTGNFCAVSKYCNIVIRSLDSASRFYLMPDNSYVSGSAYPLMLMTVGGGQTIYSVLDVEASSIGFETGSATMTLVNTDKYTGALPSGCIGVTTAQLKDAEYLSSLGFPIQT